MLSEKINARRSELLGKDFKTNSCGKCFIVDYKGAYDVTVMFYDPIYITKCSFGNLKRGTVNNPMYPTLIGVGYTGVGIYSKVTDHKCYWLWVDMLQRVHGERYLEVYPTYKDVTVCDEWLNFQNFAAWCYNQDFFNDKDERGKTYHLDKDVLIKGNKVYSPEACCFIPNEINSLFCKSNAIRGDNPIGVCRVKGRGKFQAGYRRWNKRVSLGRSFETPEEAFQAYKEAKEVYIKEVAERWEGKISDKVYDALIRYEVSVND